MKARKWMWIGLMSVGALPSWASAQIPGAPPAGPAGIAAGAGFGAPAAGGPAAAQPTTLWSFLGLSCDQIEACKQKICAKPIGQFFNHMTMPMATFTGGVIGPCCPPLVPLPQELADQGAVGAAAKIKAEEAQAKARRAAMRYLGTVDCTRFPEAGDALIMGLRGDTNECVRYEAALALGSGCCCNKATMEALSIAAACSDRDGKPREYSDRVRSAAAAALARCLSCYVDPNPPKQEKIKEGKIEEGRTDQKPEEIRPPVPEIKVPTNSGDGEDDSKKDSKETIKDNKEKKEVATAKAPRPVGLDYYRKIESSVPRQAIIEEGRKVIEKYNEAAMARGPVNRSTSIVGIINQATADNTVTTSPTAMEGGIPTARAEVVSARPQNLWDMVSRNAEPPVQMNLGHNDVVVKNSMEPPTTIVKSAPIPMPVPNSMSTRVENTPIFPEPTIVKTEPSIAPMRPTERGPYGEVTAIRSKNSSIIKSDSVKAEVAAKPAKTIDAVPPTDFIALQPQTTLEAKSEPIVSKPMLPSDTIPLGEAPGKPIEPPVNRPKTTAELAMEPRSTNKIVVPSQLPVTAAPNQLPTAVTNNNKPAEKEVAKDTKATTESQSMKPVEPPKPAKAPEPAVPTPTPLATRAITVMTEPNPAAVREQIAASLTKADFDSSSALAPVLVELARGTDPDSTRKAAIQALVRNQITSPAVLTALENLADHAPPTIRVEAAIGLARLKVGK